jgi:hypothetical protein
MKNSAVLKFFIVVFFVLEKRVSGNSDSINKLQFGDIKY